MTRGRRVIATVCDTSVTPSLSPSIPHHHPSCSSACGQDLRALHEDITSRPWTFYAAWLPRYAIRPLSTCHITLPVLLLLPEQRVYHTCSSTGYIDHREVMFFGRGVSPRMLYCSEAVVFIRLGAVMEVRLCSNGINNVSDVYIYIFFSP